MATEKTSTRLGKRLRNWGIYLLGTFVLLEVVLRLCFPLPEIRNLDRICYEMVNAGTPYNRNLVRTWESQPDTSAVFEHRMNSYGFRDGEWTVKKPPGKQRVLFVGDSFIEGVMASQEETIPAGFARKASPGRYQVMNAGMVGRGLEAYLKLINDFLPLYRPDVLFFCIYANDLSPRPPQLPDTRLNPEFYSWYKPRLLEWMHTSEDYGPLLPAWSGKARSYLAPAPSPDNPWTDREAELGPHVSPAMIAEMKQGRFNPFRLNNLAHEEFIFKQPPAFGETFSFLRSICLEFQVQPVVVYFPSRNQVTRHYYPYEREICLRACPDSLDLTGPAYQIHAASLAQACQGQGIPFMDFTGFVREREAAGSRMFWNYDEHMKGFAYLQVGEELWRRFRNL